MSVLFVTWTCMRNGHDIYGGGLFMKGSLNERKMALRLVVCMSGWRWKL